MGYYVSGAGRRAVLGLSSTQTTALVATGANMVIPGSGPLVAVGASVLSNLFGGAARDAKRQARETWFEQAARQGSILAARVLIGGTQNTAGNESPMYRDGISRLSNDPRSSGTMATANSIGPYWRTDDNDTADKMRAEVEAELLASAQVVPAPSSSSSSGYTPAGTSVATYAPAGAPGSASFNWKPWAIGAGAVGLGLLIVPRIISPSRRR